MERPQKNLWEGGKSFQIGGSRQYEGSGRKGKKRDEQKRTEEKNANAKKNKNWMQPGGLKKHGELIERVMRMCKPHQGKQLLCTENMY